MAPPSSNSCSVNVVLPASGWEMMAKVRRRAASAAIRSAPTAYLTSMSVPKRLRVSNSHEAVPQLLAAPACGVYGPAAQKIRYLKRQAGEEARYFPPHLPEILFR